MADKSITRIDVEGLGVSVIGLKELMEEMAPTHADRSDEEAAAVLLERIEKENYIPGKARDGRRQAFLREFRKLLGQPFVEEAPKGLGVGCSQRRIRWKVGDLAPFSKYLTSSSWWDTASIC